MESVEIKLRRKEVRKLRLPSGCTVVCSLIQRGKDEGSYKIYYANRFVGKLDLAGRGYSKVINGRYGME